MEVQPGRRGNREGGVGGQRGCQRCGVAVVPLPLPSPPEGRWRRFRQGASISNGPTYRCTELLRCHLQWKRPSKEPNLSLRGRTGAWPEPCSRCADSVEYGSALRGQRSQPLALETEAAGSLGTIGRATSRSCRCGVPLCAYSTQGRWSLQEAGLAVVTQRSMPSSSWLALSGWPLVCG